MNEWERRIIDHPTFQRLRRIRQLAWTDLVYPGAMHTRFEHSLGVMHVATLLYDSILKNSGQVLQEHFKYTRLGLERDRQKVRLAALLHDVGHSPFSHASETLFPERTATPAQPELFVNPNAQKAIIIADPSKAALQSRCFEHEDYSRALIVGPLREAIDDDVFNKRNYGITANDVSAILEGTAEAGPALFWRDLLTNQLDADRMDYLLRDSHHIGVSYGKYDLHRLVSTIMAFRNPESNAPRIGISNGGWNAAESLILARYSMFKQVYLHKTRIAFDVHIRGAVKSLLPGGTFPPPDDLKKYQEWDDWKVLGLLAAGEGGEHGDRIRKRNHFRLVHRTKDFPRDIKEWQAENTKLEAVEKDLGDLIEAKEKPKNKWYMSTESVDIPVVNESDPEDVRPLSEYSHLLKDFVAQSPTFIFVKPENAQAARERVKKIVKIESLDVVTDEQAFRPGPGKVIITPKEGGGANVG
jgi:HD superfamily phosphohydrolase